MPAQTEAAFEIDEYFQVRLPSSTTLPPQPCYLYECVVILRALMLQKSAPAKWKVAYF